MNVYETFYQVGSERVHSAHAVSASGFSDAASQPDSSWHADFHEAVQLVCGLHTGGQLLRREGEPLPVFGISVFVAGERCRMRCTCHCCIFCTDNSCKALFVDNVV